MLLFLFLFLFKVVFARSVSHRPGLSITPGGDIVDNIVQPNRKENCHSFSRMLRFNLLGVAITSAIVLRNSLRIVSQYASPSPSKHSQPLVADLFP